MRVLLDEGVDTSLRHHFSAPFHLETVEYQGWKGLDNGDLLRAAENDFNVLVTRDRDIPDQQKLSRFEIAIVILRPAGQELEDFLELMPELEDTLPGLQSGEVAEIHPPQNGIA